MLHRQRQENASMPAPMGSPNTSLFSRGHYHKTTFNMGDLIPFTVHEQLPGDRWNLGVEALLRFPKTLFPIMEDLQLHVAFFSVNNDLLWDKWKAFIKPDVNVSADWTTTPTPMVKGYFEYDPLMTPSDRDWETCNV